jgi:tRNA A-37 threonylcarbamoyl transferase component Bud32
MLASVKSSVVCSWTNGRKAIVYLVELESGQRMVLKRYRVRFLATMVREYLLTTYLSHRLDITPKVVAFKPFSRELVVEFIPGERVLEWVLARYGDNGIRLEEFRSYDYLDTCNIVGNAFRRFRSSESPEAIRLKQAIRESYGLLHRTGCVHGSADPRNIIYDSKRVFIIDLDHARPSLNPRSLENRSLSKWYGITLG